MCFFMRPALLWLHAKGCNIVVLWFTSHRTIEMLGPVALKLDRFQTVRDNIVVVPCKWMQHVGPNNVVCFGQQCCVRLI